MKRLLAIIALSLSLALHASAQSCDAFVPIAKYMAAADVESLSAWFAPSLEVTLPGSMPSDCSMAQAKQILKAFFRNYKPEKFEINHQAGRGTLKYALGRLTTGSGNFNVTIFVSYKEDKGYLIQQIKIERL